MTTLNEAQLDAVLAKNKIGDIPVYDQMYLFLRAFQDDEDVDVRDCFLLANYFYLYLGGDKAIRKEMNLEEAAQFFDNLGDNKGNAISMKAVIKENDFDNNNMMSFVEFGLIYYKKTTDALRNNDVDNRNAGLLKNRANERKKLADLKELIESLNSQVNALENPGLQVQKNYKGVVGEDKDEARSGIAAYKIQDLKDQLKKAEVDLSHQKNWTLKAENAVIASKPKLKLTLLDLGLTLFFNQTHYHKECLKKYSGLERFPLDHGYDIAQYQINLLKKKAEKKFGASAEELSDAQLAEFGLSSESVAWSSARPLVAENIAALKK